jgi:hypothetical protein
MFKSKKIIGVVLAAFLAVSFGAPPLAAEDVNISADLYWEVLDAPDEYYGIADGPYPMDVPQGTTLKDAIDLSFGPNGVYGDWGVDWGFRYDEIAGELTYDLESFVDCDATNDYYYPTFSESGDWGWIFTVNGNQPYFTVADPVHLKAMSQYALQPGDEVQLTYSYITSEWVDYDYLSFSVWDEKDGSILYTYTYGAIP